MFICVSSAISVSNIPDSFVLLDLYPFSQNMFLRKHSLHLGVRFWLSVASPLSIFPHCLLILNEFTTKSIIWYSNSPYKVKSLLGLGFFCYCCCYCHYSFVLSVFSYKYSQEVRRACARILRVSVSGWWWDYM